MPSLAITAHHGQSSASPHCEFCDEFAGGAGNAFHARYKGTPKRRILMATRNFMIFPSLGQLVEGYLLVAPSFHCQTIDEIPTFLLDELIETGTRVTSALSRAYGPCIWFEHGARGSSNGGCGIYHAHLHALPVGNLDDPVRTLKASFPYRELSSLHEMESRSAALPSYLFYKDSAGKLYLFDTGPLPSQHMRRVLAKELELENWDWRTAGREERLLATIERLSPHFEAMQIST